MDLSRIEAWTREMLESEAVRRGIRSPEFRTRTELVRLILRDQYGERLAVGRELIALGAKQVASARGALAGKLGAALAALPEPLDVLARLRGRVPLGREAEPRSSGRPSAARPASRPTTTAVEVEAPRQQDAATAPASDPLPEQRPEAVPAGAVSAQATRGGAARRDIRDAEDSRATWVEAEPEAAAAAAYERVVAEERQSLAPAHAAPLTVPAGTFAPRAPGDVGFRVPSVPPPAAARSGASSAAATAPRGGITRTFVEEPIRTVSMARLLAAQGHRERALAIYEELIAQNSEDASLRDEAEALRAGQAADKPLSAPPLFDEEPELPESADRLWCEGVPAQGMRLRWELSEHGQQRARAVLGRNGELAVRVVSIAFDPVRVVRSEITEHGPIDAVGEWTAPALTDSARCFAAVGLRDGERFVAVVHARAG